MRLGDLRLEAAGVSVLGLRFLQQNPKHSTLNPKSSTRNPEPSTLKPKLRHRGVDARVAQGYQGLGLLSRRAGQLLLPQPILNLGFRVEGSGFRVEGLGSGVEGLGFRVWGLGFRELDGALAKKYKLKVIQHPMTLFESIEEVKNESENVVGLGV